MSHTFKVGEIVEIVYSRYHRERNYPIEAEVTGGLDDRYNTCEHRYETCYEIRHAYGVYLALPDQLRKRRPPQDWVKLCNLDALPKEIAHV